MTHTAFLSDCSIRVNQAKIGKRSAEPSAHSRANLSSWPMSQDTGMPNCPVEQVPPESAGSPTVRGFRFDGWELHQKSRSLRDANGGIIDLSKREFSLLTCFLEAPLRPLSRLHLMRATRMHEDIFDRSIDVQILRLRRKLEANPSARKWIKTVRGIGYRFEARVETLF